MLILTISGSLRAVSSNTAFLKAAEPLAPEGVVVVGYAGIAALPFFNPDLDVSAPPEAVARWRVRLKESGALLIASPEYAGGVPGLLKNALDWVVSSGELAGKPVGIVNATPAWTGGESTQRHLIETLTLMSARVIPAACLDISSTAGRLGLDGRLTDAATSRALAAALVALARA